MLEYCCACFDFFLGWTPSYLLYCIKIVIEMLRGSLSAIGRATRMSVPLPTPLMAHRLLASKASSSKSSSASAASSSAPKKRLLVYGGHGTLGSAVVAKYPPSYCVMSCYALISNE
jgi:hypothetical protein